MSCRLKIQWQSFVFHLSPVAILIDLKSWWWWRGVGLYWIEKDQHLYNNNNNNKYKTTESQSEEGCLPFPNHSTTTAAATRATATAPFKKNTIIWKCFIEIRMCVRTQEADMCGFFSPPFGHIRFSLSLSPILRKYRTHWLVKQWANERDGFELK